MQSLPVFPLSLIVFSLRCNKVTGVCRYQDVYKGESAELLLLSNTPDFSSFKVSLLVCHACHMTLSDVCVIRSLLLHFRADSVYV